MSILKCILKLKLQYKIVLLVLAVSICWVCSGIFVYRRPEIISFSESIPSVRVKKYYSQNKVVYRSVVGEVNALQLAEITSEVSGKVTSLLINSGDAVNKNAVILAVEENDKAEQLKQAQAILKQRQLEYEVSRALYKKGYRSEVQDNAAFAALQSAYADVKKAHINFNNTKIRAPFTGYVDKVNVQVGSFVNFGQVIAKIVNFNQFKVVVNVSTKDAEMLQLNSSSNVILSNGKVFKGIVSFISKIANPQTKTYTVEVTVKNDENHFVTQGMMSNVELLVGQFKAQKVSSSLLSLNDAGEIGLKIVNDDNTVEFITVEIIDDDSYGNVWVINLPEVVNLIILGHEYSKVGTKVHVVT
ncbi:efflux RND transporter periplasmic adaptor subunit [Candidatus Neoehrlichia procyonis]|uniref:Efflux transporter, RND family, MFP subunit n=1 Tax=Candidatus Neoehrlichia procyonis str. RAC413 TaxID=1359163 RepID=A0A0F3NLM0_9RICK|nr:efflux RND transporter periplasmic adaptor subunit [Candidatus Neoehrlichia lotoris]KJV68968.1 efflux transporter, RND family, MFP subunit [Candidatus Neoehrlichia lotoris str. RAC413]